MCWHGSLATSEAWFSHGMPKLRMCQSGPSACFLIVEMHIIRMVQQEDIIVSRIGCHAAIGVSMGG